MTIDKSALDSYKSIMGDEYCEFAVDLIDTFIDSSPSIMDELRIAFENNDPETFKRAAHSLKANGKTFGAGKFAELASELEMIGKSGDLNEALEKVNAFELEYTLVISELKELKSELLQS